MIYRLSGPHDCWAWNARQGHDMTRHLLPALLACACFTAALASAQTDSSLTLRPWTPGEWGQTNDHPLYQEQGHVKGEDRNAQIFWWDSQGRFRLSGQDPNALDIGYRWVTMTFDSNSQLLPEHLDEISAAVGIHVSDSVTLVAGAGYSSNTPFADANGIFGIGHLTWQSRLNDQD